MNRNGAGEGIRTLDSNLGKVVLYPWATPASLVSEEEINRCIYKKNKEGNIFFCSRVSFVCGDSIVSLSLGRELLEILRKTLCYLVVFIVLHLFCVYYISHSYHESNSHIVTTFPLFVTHPPTPPPSTFRMWYLVRMSGSHPNQHFWYTISGIRGQ